MERKMLFAASTWSHIQNFHLPYLRHFQGLGWRVHAACGDAPASAPYTERVLEVPFTKSMGSPRNFRAAALLRELIREEGYELISVHTSLAAFFTRLALLGMGFSLAIGLASGFFPAARAVKIPAVTALRQ